MKLSTGKVAFPIEFDNGDKQCIYFNPNDKNIRERIDKFEESINQRISRIDIEKYKTRFGANTNLDLTDIENWQNISPEKLEQLKLHADVIAEFESEYNNAVKSELDTVFGSIISPIVFKYCEPFANVIVEGEDGETKSELYILHFLHWLMVELKKYGEGNRDAMQKHIGKYAK